jgi:DNA-binding transcriptional LysR family regulator
MADVDVEALARVDVNLLVAFEALVQEKNVTRAARRLAISQSAMSHTLARLRTALGDELFVRAGSGMTPTPVALRIAVPIREALARIGAVLVRSGPLDPAELRATFRLRAFDFAQIAIVPRLVAALASSAPHVTVIALAHGRDTARALEEGTADLAIGLVREPHGPTQRELSSEPFASVVRGGHPCLASPMTLERFAALRHAIVSPVGRPSGFVDGVLAEHGLARDVAYTSPHLYSAALAVARSDMILTGAARVLAELVTTLPLTLVPLPVEVPPFHVAMTWHERRTEDEVHRWLRERVIEAARSEVLRVGSQ